MTSEENKLEILRKVENGSISVEEGSELIGIIESAEKLKQQPEILDPIPLLEPVEKHETSGCWKAAWSMILLGGAVLTAFSAFWVYQGYKNAGFGWGFMLSWVPLVIGIVLMLVGWALMESPWMHVRVRSKVGEKPSNIVFSMPLPLNMARCFFRHFDRCMPYEVKEKGIPEMIDQMEESIKHGEPFQVQVDDDKNGSKVDIYIN
ncbi:MAG: hypothetical protein C0401_05965 [Anaerolinea sp.]|nr:hypothetical protein [Anaerolinea sp.]